ncbi:Vacuolar transporter chaperone 2, related [Eimeria mitis]|uniref:Vacuolar transporter chaperone 2, related n=1 Tax=Eimeria mitis TaxID=44415 RepID=U6KD63_9EIME|nr:Vacuolar transporter chaperone 2, related [Eimeria mitis]CDJ35864.1 Vacuolar transporter chaperone 2, related [Eimeria mitis]
MAAPSFHMQVPAHYLPAYVDIRRLKKQLEEVVHNAQRQRATVRRRLDILQRPRILPSGMTQKPTSPAAASEHQDTEPSSPHAVADPSQSQYTSSAAAAAARADDGMAGSSLRAEAETLSLLPEIIHLDLYIRTNHKALLFLCSHFDRLLTGVKTARWFSTSLLKEAYCNVDLERLVLMLSLLWGRFRSKLEGRQMESEAWKPPDSFVRVTTKYWVRPENIVRAQCLIVRHLPFLVFGTSDKDLEASLLDPDTTADGHKLRAPNLAPTQMVASVYFDSSGAYSYERRIRRFEGAQLLRFRWYGTNNNGPDEDIFIERKTHHESWSGMSSTKERFVVPQRLVAPYMLLQRSARDLLLEAAGFHFSATDSGPVSEPPMSHEHTGSPYPVDGDAQKRAADAYIAKNGKLKKAIQLGEEIQQAIAEHHLQPMVRISLDTNLCMVNEYRPQRQEDGGFNWCRLADELLGRDEVVRFPYAILEVKVQQQPPPAWVQSMLLLSDATLVYKFSKFQHGMAFLHRDKISSGLLPHWLQSPQSAQRQRQEDEQLSAQKNRGTLRVPPLGGSLFESLRNSPDSLLTPLTRSLTDHHLPRLLTSDALGTERRSLFPVGESEAVVAADPDWEDVTATAAHRTFCWLRAQQKRQLQQAPSAIGQEGPAEGEFEDDRPRANSGSSADSLRQRLLRRHIRTVKKIDPKTSFAAERTFLHYIQKGLYLAGASLARVAKAGAANMQQRIDSQWGPLLAFFAAGVATLLVLVLQVDVNLRSVLKHEQVENSAVYSQKQRAEMDLSQQPVNEL